GQAQSDLAHHIPYGQSEMACAHEREGVEAERGERREAAEDADDQERAQFRRDMDAFARHNTGDESDERRADDVDDEDAVRKDGREQLTMNQTVETVSRHGADRAAHADEHPDHDEASA